MPASADTGPGAPGVAVVTEADLPELLVLVRAYCDFYDTDPGDAELLALSRALIADPELEGVQFIARAREGGAVGFATVFWSWDTTEGTRVGIMNDLFVAPAARGSGAAELLVRACAERCAQRGASRLEWVTAPDNGRARALYERIGGSLQPWVTYELPVDRAGS